MGFPKYGVHIIGFCTATLVFAIALFVSADNTQILSHQHCPTAPIVNFEEDYEVVYSKVAQMIRKAVNRVQISLYDVNKTIFVDYLLDACKVAKNNGAHVRFLSKTDISDVLKQNGFSDVTIYDDILDPLWTDSVVSDDDSFISPSFMAYPRPNVFQTFESSCPVMANELMGFAEFYLRAQNNTLPVVIPPHMYGQSSPVRPTLLPNNFTLYTFYTPDQVVSPLRSHEGDVLDAMMYDVPKELIIFTDQTIGMPKHQWRKDSAFSLYSYLKGLAILNKTKIRCLTMPDIFKSISMLAFPKFQMRKYPENTFYGPQFMVADNTSYIFSIPIGGESEKFARFYSLNVVTNASEIRTNLVSFFNKVWDTAEEYNITWQDDL